MESRVDKAISNFKNGYNCSQAVICAYCDLLGMDEELAFRTSEGFGGGMGQLRDTCGAVTAMFMLAGLKGSDGQLSEGKTKLNTYGTVKNMAEEFKNKNSSIMCRDLLGVDGAPKKRACIGCVQDAAMLIEKYLLEEEKQKPDNEW